MFDESIPRDARRRAELTELADDLEASSDVRATDVVDDPARNLPVLEVVVRESCDGLTPPVMRIVAKHGATIADVTPRGEPAHAVATLV